MAEIATIARPYAEALFKAASGADTGAWASQLDALAAVCGHSQLRQFADNPKASDTQVYDLIVDVSNTPLDARVANLLRTIIENKRIAALPEIAGQFRALVNAQSGVSDATIYSAFPIDAQQLDAVRAALEKRFGRRLNTSVVIDEALIGGIRVQVGDEVLDTSVQARLAQMRTALTS